MNYEKFRANLKRRAIQEGLAEEVARDVIEGPGGQKLLDYAADRSGGAMDPNELAARLQAVMAQAANEFMNELEQSGAMYSID